MKEKLSNTEMRFGNTNFQITEVPEGMRKKTKEENKDDKNFQIENKMKHV